MPFKKLYKPLHSGDGKGFYKHIRQNRTNDSDIISDMRFKGTTAKLPKKKACMFNEFSKSVFVVDDITQLPNDFVSETLIPTLYVRLRYCYDSKCRLIYQQCK